jgi:poly(3-hydroxyalkanoate) synthetase
LIPPSIPPGVPPPTPPPVWSPGLPGWNGGWPRSKPAAAEALRISQALPRVLAASGSPPEAFQAAIRAALVRADRTLLDGILAYRAHPYRRALADPPVFWTEGSSRLLDHAAGGAAGAAGPAVLFIPSLVNRAAVLDLLPEASLLRFLAAAGVRPLLLDWGAPGALERGFSLTDYIAGRLEAALAAAVQATGGPVVLVGYCMGGLLALAAALRRPDWVSALGLLATPWDFHAAGVAEAQALAGLLPALEPLLAAAGALPVDALQAIFASLDAGAIADKYREFAGLDPGSAQARRFVALEDWLNDGVALAAPVAREALGGWYGANTPARGTWRVAGQVVDPAALRMPAFLAVPKRDRIVPPCSAEALAAALPPGAVVHQAAAGHIGMVAGRQAERVLWRPLLGWLRGPAQAGSRR